MVQLLSCSRKCGERWESKARWEKSLLLSSNRDLKGGSRVARRVMGRAGRNEGSGFGGSQAVKQSVALHEGHALQLQRCATTSAKRPGHTEQNQTK